MAKTTYVVIITTKGVYQVAKDKNGKGFDGMPPKEAIDTVRTWIVNGDTVWSKPNATDVWRWIRFELAHVHATEVAA